MPAVLIKWGNLNTEAETQKEDEKPREDSHLQACEVGLAHVLPSQPSEERQPSSPQSRETYISAQSPRRWSFVTAVLGI